MNVVFEIRGTEYVTDIRSAKRILNNMYQKSDQVYINGQKIGVDEYDRQYIINQIHGELYV